MIFLLASNMSLMILPWYYVFSESRGQVVYLKEQQHLKYLDWTDELAWLFISQTHRCTHIFIIKIKINLQNG